MKINYKEFFIKKLIYPLHKIFISQRRTKAIVNLLVQLLPHNRPLIGLDIGCGTGEITRGIQQASSSIKMTGIDVVKRKNAAIDVIEFDGKRIPFEDKSYDFTMLINVLHHVNDPVALMKECVRTSRKFIIIQDHTCSSRWDRVRLCFMDWVGNLGYNAHLPYNFLSKNEWKELFRAVDVLCEEEIHKLNLYPSLFHYLFDDKLHFAARLTI